MLPRSLVLRVLRLAGKWSGRWESNPHGQRFRGLKTGGSVRSKLRELPPRSRLIYLEPGFCAFTGLIIESQSLQNPGRMFIHSRRASRRLFRPCEMQQISFLPSGGERMKGFRQFRVIVQTR